MQAPHRLPLPQLRARRNAGAKRTSAGRGFTLVELLVVIVVIGILAAIAIPVFLSQADKASDAALKSDLANAAKLLQIAEANGETLPSEFPAGQVVDLGTAGTFTASETLTVSGSGETLCVEALSRSGRVFSSGLSGGLQDQGCDGWSPIQATGGDRTYTITVDGTRYRVHEFTTVGDSTFAITDAGSNGEVEYLIVGGGGGGGARHGGGGGAGGLLTNTGDPVSLSAQSYTVTVGDGGLGGEVDGNPISGGGLRGEDSVFHTWTAFGGGGGSSWDGAPDNANGGSGGGGAYVNGGGGGTGVPGQGFDGGTSSRLNEPYRYKHGGGGGAGGPGLDGDPDTGKVGDGGPGREIDITGETVKYAGGGGGGSHQPQNESLVDNGRGLGGSGGGGNGGTPKEYENGEDGVDGLGGGGGGGSVPGGGSWVTGGSGGSGVVIIRYRQL